MSRERMLQYSTVKIMEYGRVIYGTRKFYGNKLQNVFTVQYRKIHGSFSWKKQHLLTVYTSEQFVSRPSHFTFGNPL